MQEMVWVMAVIGEVLLLMLLLLLQSAVCMYQAGWCSAGICIPGIWQWHISSAIIHQAINTTIPVLASTSK